MICYITFKTFISRVKFLSDLHLPNKGCLNLLFLYPTVFCLVVRNILYITLHGVIIMERCIFLGFSGKYLWTHILFPAFTKSVVLGKIFGLLQKNKDNMKM